RCSRHCKQTITVRLPLLGRPSKHHPTADTSYSPNRYDNASRKLKVAERDRGNHLMPERTACDEAIRLSPTRLRIPDPDLKQGQVEMFQIHTAHHVIQRPWGIEGGFAVVYKFRTASGKLRALRCFRIPMDLDTQSRYELIGP